MALKQLLSLFVLALLSFLFSGCGQKGDLYLPVQTADAQHESLDSASEKEGAKAKKGEGDKKGENQR